MSIIRKPLVMALFALAMSSTVVPAYAQSDDSKTGTGPRGTPAAPSTNPSQANSTLKPPPGMDKSGTPVAPAMDTAANKSEQTKAKGN